MGVVKELVQRGAKLDAVDRFVPGLNERRGVKAGNTSLQDESQDNVLLQVWWHSFEVCNWAQSP